VTSPAWKKRKKRDTYWDGDELYDAPLEEYMVHIPKKAEGSPTDSREGRRVFPCHVYDNYRERGGKLIRIEHPRPREGKWGGWR